MADTTTFSTLLRERSSGAHSSSEGQGFMNELLKGEGTRDDYAALVAQHYFIYEALEAATERMRTDPVASEFISDKLTRLPALEADLEFLIGPDWRERIEPLPITAEYVQRINEIGPLWPGGFVAHHYTRYLGDLSGGIFIGRVMQRKFGFETDGVNFYRFDGIDPSAFKDAYRALLDAAPWDDAEQERVIDEVLRAYAFNTALFEDLERAKTSPVA